MKTGKIFIFCGAFLFGCFLVMVSKNPLPVEPKKENLPLSNFYDFTKEIPQTRSESEFKPEITVKDDYWDDKERKFKIKLIDMLEYGDGFRKEEVLAKSGETWLGLFKEKDKFVLQATKVKVSPERRPNYANDVMLKLDKSSKPKFLLKNAGKLRTGEVATLFSRPTSEEIQESDAEYESMKKDFIREFHLKNQKYTFRVKNGLTESGDKVLILFLESGNKTQIITIDSFFEEGDFVGDLLWVGDLDRDGKLDFYMNYNSHEKGGYGASLFLSSEAEKDKLVKEVAYFGTLGC